MLPHASARTLTAAALCAALLAPCFTRASEPPPVAAPLSVASLIETGRITDALDLARGEIAALHREPGDGPRKAAAHAADLGVQFFLAPSQSAEAWSASEEMLRDAASRYEAIGSGAEGDLAETLSNLSTVLFSQDRWDDAAAPEERALNLRTARFGPQSREAASSLQGLGLIDTRRARFEPAEARLMQALAIRERCFTEAGAAQRSERAGPQLMETLGALGDLLRLEDRLEEAEAMCRRAVDVARGAGLGESVDAAAALNNLAGVLKDQSRYDEAAPLLDESLRIRRTQGAGSADMATALLNLAELRRLQGREEDAGALYDEALAAARESLGPDNPELFWFLNQKAASLRQAGRLEKAKPFVSEGLALLEKTLGPGDPMLATAVQEMADLDCDQGSYGEASALYTRARGIRAAALGPAHPDTAVTVAAQATCAARAPQASAAAVLEMAQSALEPLRATSLYPEQEAAMLSLQAEQLWKLSRRDEAIASQREAVGLLESLRPRAGGSEWTRAGFFRRHADEFDKLAIWLLDQNQPAEALAAAERGRARALLDQLAAARVDLRAEIPEARRRDLTQRERQAALRLAEAQEKLRMARAGAPERSGGGAEAIAVAEREAARAAGEYREAYESIRDASAVWRRIQGLEPATLAGAQSGLAPRRGLILYYLVTPERSVLLAIPPAPERPLWSDLSSAPGPAAQLELPAGPVGGARLAGAVSELMTDLAAPPSPGASGDAQNSDLILLQRKLAEAFAALMPASIWEKTRKSNEVILIPDGALHALPFEALVVSSTDAGEPLRYWLDAGPTIRYAASLSLLAHLADAPAEAQAGGTFLLTVSDPAAPPGQEARSIRLPGSAAESAQVAAAVRAALPAAGITSLTGVEAAEPRVRAELPRARFIHMATHGTVDRRRSDLFAALQLAPAAGPALPETDGSLQLFEIYELRLRCDLAVLSACATQYGRQMEGEGAMALARGFMAAGSRRVVASLWPVEDLSTARLITAMFDRIARDAAHGGDIHYAQALAEARRTVRKDPRWSAPFYWAPFVLMGAK